MIRTALLPRWRGLTHFEKIIGFEFSDATKFEDLLRVSAYAKCSGFGHCSYIILDIPFYDPQCSRAKQE
jgi:hypothetical protein